MKLLSLVIVLPFIHAKIRGETLEADPSGRSWENSLPHRVLQQNRPCDELITTVTAAEVRDAGNLFIEPIVKNISSSYLNPSVASGIIFQSVQYDFEVWKLCSSCKEIDNWYYTLRQLFPGYHAEYCGSDKYGWGVVQSFLVLLPIDPMTGKLFNEVKLRAFISMPTSREDLNSAPTVAFPSSLSTFTKSVQAGETSFDTFLTFLTNYLPAVTAAASGSVAVVPDLLGYGESTSLNRTLFWPHAYEQAGVIAFLNLQRWLKNTTKGCTLLDTALTLQGLEEGAFAVPFVAQALQRFGFKGLSVLGGAGPWDLDTWLFDTFKSAEQGAVGAGSPIYDLLPRTVFAFSSDIPGILNTGSGQYLASSQYRSDILARYQSTDQVVATGRQFSDTQSLLDMLNPDLIALYRQAQTLNLTAPCNSTLVQDYLSVEKLCEAIKDVSAWPVFLGTNGRKWVYPFKLCASPEDELYSSDQYIQAVLSLPLVGDYKGPVGLEKQLTPTGDHSTATLYCTLPPLLFFTLQGERPDNELDRANYQVPLNGSELDLCRTGSFAPTPAPPSNVSLAPSPAALNQKSGGSSAAVSVAAMGRTILQVAVALGVWNSLF